MSKTIIIAEAGANHNGSIKLAKKLIDVASMCGADYVKFQTFISNLVYSETTPKAPYQRKNTPKNLTAIQVAKKLELTEKDHLSLVKYCKKRKIGYLTTFHDLKSLKSYSKFKLDYIKIASGDINNLPYLEEVSKIKKKIILSTGLSTMLEITKAIKILTKKKIKKKDLVVLHCNSAYPSPLKDINLNAISTIKKKLGVSVGYSDHTLGYEVSLAACAIGACLIEKHFTLNKKLSGPDHKASLSPRELSKLVKYIRNIDIAKGYFEKKPSPSELKNKFVVRKSIVANKKINKGEIFTRDNIFVKRPAAGKSPMKFNNILGKKSKKNYEVDDLI